MYIVQELREVTRNTIHPQAKWQQQIKCIRQFTNSSPVSNWQWKADTTTLLGHGCQSTHTTLCCVLDDQQWSSSQYGSDTSVVRDFDPELAINKPWLGNFPKLGRVGGTSCVLTYTGVQSPTSLSCLDLERHWDVQAPSVKMRWAWALADLFVDWVHLSVAWYYNAAKLGRSPVDLVS